ncbi:MAG: potassium channel protein [Deltaproteobacteria bacterium]|nr:potassium channel protein [Deltaproteobacteria bacterium]
MVIRQHISAFIKALRRERVFVLMLAVISLVFLGAIGFFITEPGEGHWWDRFGRGAWWALVTLATVGYGDVVPVTLGGRVVGIFVILGGVLSLSLLTATVASIFVERKFRRERGLEPIKITQQILVLGWHEDVEIFLDQLLRRLTTKVPVVLVNKQPPEQMEALREKYAGKEIRYLWGDYSREETLLKANVQGAVKAIILAERHPEEDASQVDQRTLFTALTLKAVHPKIRIMAELLRLENRAHLERAGVEEVMIRGQYDSYLMAGAVSSPGFFRVITSLLTVEGQSLWAVEVPSRFQGRLVKELAAHLRERHQATLVALYTEGRALSLEDLLSEEPSAIDDFIRRKFAETKMTHLFGRAKVECQVNPPDNQTLAPHQYAVVIAAQRPNL